MEEQSVIIYTDGACNPNPGPGGWGFVIKLKKGSWIEGSGYSPRTTNNQMEILSAIKALKSLPYSLCSRWQ